MGVGCQSRRFNCLFWRETRQRILGHEISPYPEVVRGGERELTTRPSREAVGSWTGERERVGGRRPREAVGGWTGERRVGVRRPREEVGGWRAERQAAEGSCGWRPRRAWKNGQGQSTPDTEQRGEETR